MNTIIVSGPKGCGKTTNAEAIRAHLGCTHIVDDWVNRQPLIEGALHLTYDWPTAAVLRKAPAGTKVLRYQDVIAAAKAVPQLPISVKVKKLHPDARLPVYGTDGAACFDLAALERASIAAHGSAVIRTGLTFEIPEGHVMLVFSRSGHGFKNSIRLANCVGVIDADYRGEVMVKLTSDLSPFQVEPGDRIAQAMVIPFPRVTFEEVEELSSTERGAGGFGSTGVK